MKYQRYLGPALIGVAAIAVLAVLGVPVFSYLPYLAFLACPLMMVFMMKGMSHGHGHGGSQHHSDESPDTPTTLDDLR